MRKLKSQFQRRRIVLSRRGLRVKFPDLRSVVHKQFSNRQERSRYCLDLVEYGDYPLKLRVARGSRLPDPRDDYPSLVMDSFKSWKHHSKRRKQYVA
ncbi:hypothetical protein AB4571_01145 [Vibrio breoganii]|uniref:hypothetical protein n=1 Tax=Vibrio breoganii TaxID=553239 RepID=UPI0009EE53A3|nr:hypothetical protein [Vibrio breoganii]